MNKITYKLLDGETIDNKDLMPVLDIVKKELKIANTMKEFVALITIPANNEEDFMEQLDALDCYELEWFKEVKTC